MTFEKWVQKADIEISSAMKKELHHSILFRDGSHKGFLFPYYEKYKMFQETKKLVLATWLLAMTTILLSGLTIYFQYFKK